jgi:POT family proton-dependent oligopeptide transporter
MASIPPTNDGAASCLARCFWHPERIDATRRPAAPAGVFHLLALIFLERIAGCAFSASLVLYVAGCPDYSQAEALQLGATVSALGYAGTILAGWLADRWLGLLRSLRWGCAVLAGGYGLLSLHSPPSMTAALALIALGNALFRPTLSALLCLLYPPQDARLPTAQTVLYVVANLGGLLGAVGAGVLLHLVGRGSSFRLATCAMGLGCLLLQCGSPVLQTQASITSAGAQPTESPASRHRFRHPQHDAVMFLAILLATVLLSLCFGQVEGALLLEFSRSIAPLRSHTHMEALATWPTALPAALVVMLGPGLMRFLRRLRSDVLLLQLIALGLLALAAGFAALLPAYAHRSNMAAEIISLACCLLLLALGEILIAPQCLSLLARLAPPQHLTLCMGAWYLALAIGAWLAGEAGTLWLRWPRLHVLLLLTLLPLGGALLFAWLLRTERRRR